MVDTPRGVRGVGDEVGEMDGGWIKAMLPVSMESLQNSYQENMNSCHL